MEKRLFFRDTMSIAGLKFLKEIIEFINHRFDCHGVEAAVFKKRRLI